jgi:hypothetical protein
MTLDQIMMAAEALERAAIATRTHPAPEAERRLCDARGLLREAVRSVIVKQNGLVDALGDAERLALRVNAKRLAARLRYYIG